MNDMLPSGSPETDLPSAGAVLAGVLVGFGAFALLISIVAAFANGAHSHQVLSAATWKQLGTGGGIVTGIALFVAWAAGGFIAARLAGRDGMRHGVWVFIAGVVLITIVGAAITWLPDTTAILRNLRLLGLPLRRNEWRDFGTVAGVASILGMGAGAIAGGWWALREVVPAPAAAPVPAPAVTSAPVPVPATAPEQEEEGAGEPAYAGPSLFEPVFESETEFEPPAPAAPAPEPEPAGQDSPAWLQFIEERQRAIRERDRGDVAVDEPPAPAPAPAPGPAPFEPAPWTESEPPTFIEEPEDVPAEAPGEPVQATSWWPGQAEPPGQAQPAFDDAWALPDDEPAAGFGEGVEDAAFPHPPPTPVGQVDDGESFVPPPPAEHVEWSGHDSSAYQAPPEPGDEHSLQEAPEAPVPEIDEEELEARRRQQEEAARAYEQMRDDQ